MDAHLVLKGRNFVELNVLVDSVNEVALFVIVGRGDQEENNVLQVLRNKS